MPVRALRRFIFYLLLIGFNCQNQQMPVRALRPFTTYNSNRHISLCQNQQMPVRALRPSYAQTLQTQIRQRQNQQMPVRALRGMWAGEKLPTPILSESTHARQGIKRDVWRGKSPHPNPYQNQQMPWRRGSRRSRG